MKRWIVVIIALTLPLLACGGSDGCAEFEHNLAGVHVDCSYRRSTAFVAGSCLMAKAVVSTWARQYPCITGTTIKASANGYAVTWTMQ